jgi:regulatory protein
MRNPHSSRNDPQASLSPLDYAYRLLARRDYSEQELSHKLLAKGFTRQAVTHTITRLKEQKYLNDPRLVANQVERLSAQGFGLEGIKAKLAQKGFSSEIIERAIAANEKIDSLASARHFLASRFLADALKQPQVYARAFRLLLRRGYSYDVVESVMGNAPGEKIES